MRIPGLFWVLAGLMLLAACDSQIGDDDAEQGPGNQALVMSGYAAFAAGDMATVTALLDPDLVWYEAESLPYGGIYHGPDAVMENIFMAIARDWDDYAAEPQRFIDGGDHIVVLGEYRGVHRESGGRMQVPFVHVWQMAGGRLVEFHQFTDTAAWLAAARGHELVD
jgi:uncharacterized protein